MKPWLIDTEIFVHPFSCLISGSTASGKSFLLKEILKYKNILIKGPPERIIFCYSAWQTNYDEIQRLLPLIEFNEGIIDTDIIHSNQRNLIIFDDLMKECLASESVMKLFTVGSHHRNCSIFFISQNVFSQGKYARDISLNANYMIVFKNHRDQMQFKVLGRQMYPNNSKFLMESFDDSTKKPYGYILFDLKQTSESRNRVQTGILPYQQRIIYTSKN